MGQKENPTQCKKPSDKFGGLVWIGSQIGLRGRQRVADSLAYLTYFIKKY